MDALEESRLQRESVIEQTREVCDGKDLRLAIVIMFDEDGLPSTMSQLSQDKQIEILAYVHDLMFEDSERIKNSN